MDRPEYSEVLRAARMGKGLTIEDMAELMDVSTTTISCWERGKAYPDAKRLALIQEKLGIVVPGRPQ